jgi:hypothetical protein
MNLPNQTVLLLILMAASSITLGMLFYNWMMRIYNSIKTHGLVLPIETWRKTFKRKPIKEVEKVDPLSKDVSDLSEMVKNQNKLMREFIGEIRDIFSKPKEEEKPSFPPFIEGESFEPPFVSSYPPALFEHKEETSSKSPIELMPVGKDAITSKKKGKMFSQEEIDAEILRKGKGVTVSTDLTGGIATITSVNSLEFVRDTKWYKDQSRMAYSRLWGRKKHSKNKS